MSETSKNLGKTVIVKDLADLATKLAGGTLTDGITILFNGVSVTAWSGNGAPTSSQLAHNIDDIYYDETNDTFYLCKSAVVTNGAVVTAWKRVATEEGGTTLDATLIPRKQYTLADQSATFNMVLPASGGYQDYIEIIFKATAAFTPTTSGGTVVGDTIPTTVANKTYGFLFCWVGNAWRFQYLGW